MTTPENTTPAETESAREMNDRALGNLTSEQVPQLTLHTRLGQNLFYGRKPTSGQHEIVGLVRFASQVRYIWNGACHDDPYADWWLIKVDQALQMARTELQRSTQQMQQRFTELADVSLSVGVSEKPLQVPLQFTSPYAYQGAYLLADLDGLARMILSARHFALIPSNDANRLLKFAGRSVRRAFLSPMPYKFLGLSRIDLAQGTAKVEQARQLMGEVPDDILKNETRARYAPAAGAKSLIGDSESAV
jgi:integrating conjugative element protein (TIGR03761 family)